MTDWAALFHSLTSDNGDNGDNGKDQTISAEKTSSFWPSHCQRDVDAIVDNGKRQGATSASSFLSDNGDNGDNGKAAAGPQLDRSHCQPLSMGTHDNSKSKNTIESTSLPPNAAVVTDVTIVTIKRKEEAAPSPLSVALTTLERRRPDHVEVADWQHAVEDGRRFLNQWGEQATALGWTEADIFGLPPVPANPDPRWRRLARVDHLGLAWMLHGQPVTSVTAECITIATPGGGSLTFRRPRSDGVVEAGQHVEQSLEPPAPPGQPASDTMANPNEDAASIVAIARAAGVILSLVERNTLFAIEWRTKRDARIEAALIAKYDEVLDLLKREAAPPIDTEVAKVVRRIDGDCEGDDTATVPAAALSDEACGAVLDHNAPGARCAQCSGKPDGKEKPFIRGSETVWLHQECVRFYPSRAALKPVRSAAQGEETAVGPAPANQAAPPKFKIKGWGRPGSLCEHCGRGIGIVQVEIEGVSHNLHRQCITAFITSMAQDGPESPTTAPTASTGGAGR